MLLNREFYKKTKAATLVILAMLSACTAVGKIEKQPDGSYVLRKVDHKGIFGSMSSLKDATTEEADEFAKKEGKKIIPLGEREHPIGIAGDWAWYEVTFRLGDPQADEAKINSCFERIKREKSLQVIAGKLSLGGVKEQSFSMLANRDKATETEKPAISLYADMRKKCVNELVEVRRNSGAPQAAINVTESSLSSIENALVALYGEAITYGDFAKFRKEVYDNENVALAKINEELRRDATDTRERAEQLANQSKVAQAQMWQAISAQQQAFASQQAANAMMIQANKPPQRFQTNCRTTNLGFSSNTECN